MDMIKYKLSYEIYIYLFKEIILEEIKVFLAIYISLEKGFSFTEII